MYFLFFVTKTSLSRLLSVSLFCLPMHDAPAVEKTLSMAVEDAGMVSKSKAILDSIGYVASEVIQKSIGSAISELG